MALTPSHSSDKENTTRIVMLTSKSSITVQQPEIQNHCHRHNCHRNTNQGPDGGRGAPVKMSPEQYHSQQMQFTESHCNIICTFHLQQTKKQIHTHSTFHQYVTLSPNIRAKQLSGLFHYCWDSWERQSLASTQMGFAPLPCQAVIIL